MKAKLFFIIIAGVYSSCTHAQQPSSSVKTVTNDTIKVIDCRGKKYNINYPKKNFSKVNTHNYTEGYFMAITYRDSSYIQIHCGSMVKHPLIPITPTDSIKENGYSKRLGYSDNQRLSWREDFYPSRNLTILYMNVPSGSKEVYDKVLDSFKEGL